MPEERQTSTDGETDWEEILLDGFDADGGMAEQRDDREHFEPVSVATADLDDHLREQIPLLELTPRQRVLADEFIGNIDEDGYLVCDARRDPRAASTTMIADAAAARGPRRRAAPFLHDGRGRGDARHHPAARPARASARATCASACSCSSGSWGRTKSLARRLVGEFFDELIAHRWADVARKTGVSARRGAAGRRPDREARPQARPGQVQRSATTTSFPT